MSSSNNNNYSLSTEKTSLNIENFNIESHNEDLPLLSYGNMIPFFFFQNEPIFVLGPDCTKK